jgi:hypothetical protein
MAATISLEFRQLLLQMFFQRDIAVSTDTLFVALTHTVPLANQSGFTLDEPEAGAYNRAAVELNSDNWALSGFGEVMNSADVDFPGFEPGEDWGYLMGWALLDSPSSGMTYAVGSLIQPTLATSDMPPVAMQPGGIVLALFD